MCFLLNPMLCKIIASVERLVLNGFKGFILSTYTDDVVFIKNQKEISTVATNVKDVGTISFELGKE